MAYTSKYTGEEIDAKLDEVKPVGIVDGLESDDSASALSARQGKVLKEMIEGGITEEKEVYIGEEAPTDDNVKVWIDPNGTPSSPSQPSAGVEVIDNLESDSTTAALSANQGRVLKEMIGQGSGNGGGTSGGGSTIVIYCPLDYSFGEGQKESNATNVALLIEDYNKGIYHSNIIIAMTMQGVVQGWCNPILCGLQNGTFNTMISMTAVGDDNNNMVVIAMRLSVDASGNVSIQ